MPPIKQALPKVSLIVPVYNAERTIAECIKSILALDYPQENLELIIIDNSSTDGTTNILEQFSDKINIFHEKKKGPAAARNKGILKANANIIVFTDSDCIVDKEWLRHIVSPLQDERIGIVGGKILAKRPCNELEKFGEKIHDHENIIKKFKPPYVITMNWASRKVVLKELGLFDEKFIRGQDVDLSFRILKKGYELVYEPKAIVYHRNENTLIGLFLEGYAHGVSSLRIIKKNKDFMKQFGYRRFNPKSYYNLLSYLIDYIKDKNSHNAFYNFIFNLGKIIGKVYGSMRFFYLDI